MNTFLLAKFKRTPFSMLLVFSLLAVEILTLCMGVLLSAKTGREVTSVNLAGRQRMLSQRLSKSLLYIYVESLENRSIDRPLQELKYTTQLFHSTLLGFQKGGFVTNTDNTEIAIPSIQQPEAEQILAQAFTLWLPYHRILTDLFSEQSLQNKKLKLAVQYSKEHNLKLLSLMNELTLALEKEAVFYTRFLQYTQLTGFILVIVLFAFLFSRWQQIRELLLSQQAQIQSQLANAEESLKLAVDGSNDGLWDCTDLTSRTQWVSDRFCQLLGYGEQSKQLASIDYFLSLIHPEDRMHVMAAINEHLQQRKPYKVEYRIYTQHQGYRWFLARGQALWNEQGQAIRMSGSLTDIHFIKQTSNQLKSQAQLYSTLINTIPHVIWLAKANGFIEFFNMTWFKLTGLSAAESLGDGWVNSIHPDEVTAFIQQWDTGVKSSKRFEGELRIKLVDKNYHLFHYICTPVLNEHEQITNWVGVSIDISYIRQAEQVLKDFNQRLTEEVEVRTRTLLAQEAELRKAKEAAEVANRAKTIFLANMSHELRTPLNAILGYLQMLQWEKNLTHEQQRAILVAYRNSQHLSTLLNDLLELSRIESNHLSINESEFLLSEFLQDLTDIFSVRAIDKNLSFKTELAGNLPMSVVTDAIRLRQILFNLLSNAIKFTEVGTVTLQVEIQEEQLFFGVYDTGCGIAEHDQSLIFESFHQLGDIKQKSEGMGLGLAISQRLVQLMGGSLHVRSNVNEGSRFWFKVPFMFGSLVNGNIPERLIVGIAEQRNPHLLLADNSTDNLHMLNELLSALGFKTHTAQNGEEAWQVLEQQPKIELVISDLNMPLLNGIELTQRIRQSTHYHNLPVIVLSGSVFRQAKELCQAAGVNYFLGKPIQLELFFNYIQQLLNLEWIYKDQYEAPQLSSKPDIANMHLPSLAQLEKIASELNEGNFNAAVQAVKELVNFPDLVEYTTILLQWAELYEVDLFEQLIVNSIQYLKQKEADA